MRPAGLLGLCCWAALAAICSPNGHGVETAVEDVLVRVDRDAAAKSRQRVMIGPLADGSGYFARIVASQAPDRLENGIDDPTQERLWTFTDGGLGQVRGRARIALSNAEDNRGLREWAALFGSGYRSSAEAAGLFVVFLDRGVDGWADGDFVKVSADARAGYGQAGLPPLPNGMGEPALLDADLNGTADLAYAGDLLGGLYRFDIADRDPAHWSATLIFHAVHGERQETLQPIVQRPFVVAHPRGDGFFVVFATGDSRTEQDRSSTDVQSIYGIWDPGAAAPATARQGAKRDRLVRRRLVNVVEERNGAFEWRRVLVGEPLDYAVDAPGRTGVYGWYIDLDMPRAERTSLGNANPDTCGLAPPDPQYPGERVAGPIAAHGKTLFLLTALPSGARVCGSAPPGSILAIDTITGGNAQGPGFDLNDDGSVDGGDLIVYEGVAVPPGMVLDRDGFTELPGRLDLTSNPDGTAELMVGEGAESLSLTVGAPGDVRTGRLSWRELRGSEP